MGLKLGGDHSLKGFGDEGEVGDGPVVVQISWVSTGFFEGWCNCSSFEGGGYSTSGEGGVNDSCDHGGDGGQTGFDEDGGEGIELDR